MQPCKSRYVLMCKLDTFHFSDRKIIFGIQFGNTSFFSLYCTEIFQRTSRENNAVPVSLVNIGKSCFEKVNRHDKWFRAFSVCISYVYLVQSKNKWMELILSWKHLFYTAKIIFFRSNKIFGIVNRKNGNVTLLHSLFSNISMNSSCCVRSGGIKNSIWRKIVFFCYIVNMHIGQCKSIFFIILGCSEVVIDNIINFLACIKILLTSAFHKQMVPVIRTFFVETVIGSCKFCTCRSNLFSDKAVDNNTFSGFFGSCHSKF